MASCPLDEPPGPPRNVHEYEPDEAALAKTVGPHRRQDAQEGRQGEREEEGAGLGRNCEGAVRDDRGA